MDLIRKQPHYVYRLYDKDGRLLYVGMTTDLGHRLKNHQHSKPWFADVAFIGFDRVRNWHAALDMERDCIMYGVPIHNIRQNYFREDLQKMRPELFA